MKLWGISVVGFVEQVIRDKTEKIRLLTGLPTMATSSRVSEWIRLEKKSFSKNFESEQ